jgi:hypothetical protein
MRTGAHRTVWARIKEALEDKELPATQAYAAIKLLNIRQPSVSDWNKPDRYPTIENAIELASKLGVCVEWLLTERGPKHPGRPDDEFAVALFRIWDELSEDAKRHIVGFATVNRQAPADGALPPSGPAKRKKPELGSRRP